MPNKSSRNRSRVSDSAASTAGFRAVAACLLLAAAGIAAYADSLHGEMVFDDDDAIVKNESIRDLTSWDVLRPPGNGTAVQGRPVVNLSLAVNYALGGPDGLRVEGYHAVNVGIHLLVGLTLFGLLRRTLELPRLRAVFDVPAAAVAFAVALLWIVHPITTEAVAYITQRTESLVSLFYLLTLYCLLRGATAADPRRWYLATVAACAAGMATKEVMVTAPVVAAAFDRIFLGDSWRDCLRRRGRLHAALFATWGIPAYLLLSSGGRGATAGLGLGLNSWEYLRLQVVHLVDYLRLCFWPHPLVFDYGIAEPQPSAVIGPSALVVGALAAATMIALVRRPAWGFPGLLFFALLAPSSSVVPIVTEVAAERRVYLASAAVLTVFVIGLFAVARKAVVRNGSGATLRRAAVAAWGLLLAVAAGLGTLTVIRNHDYRTRVSIWESAVAVRPLNPRARFNLANEYLNVGRTDDAIAQYRETLALAPLHAKAHANLGNALLQQGDVDEAAARIEQALAIEPDALDKPYRPGSLDAERHLAYFNLGNVRLRQGRTVEAAAAYGEALKLNPRFEPAWTNLGSLEFQQGRTAEAVAHFRRAVEEAPAKAAAHGNLGVASAKSGRVFEAAACYRRALELDPKEPNSLNNLAWLSATCPNEQLRDGRQALELAGRAMSAAVPSPGVQNYRTLAAALAEAGNYRDASRAAKTAADMALGRGNAALAEVIHAEFRLYLTDQPLRDVTLIPVDRP